MIGPSLGTTGGQDLVGKGGGDEGEEKSNGAHGCKGLKGKNAKTSGLEASRSVPLSLFLRKIFISLQITCRRQSRRRT